LLIVTASVTERDNVCWIGIEKLKIMSSLYVRTT